VPAPTPKTGDCQCPGSDLQDAGQV
jgi:hypothetical protein